jgi:hypothetical protein
MSYSNHQYERNPRKSQLSRHAGVRAQQRGINTASIPLVLAYGHREFDGHGAVRYLMTSDSVASLTKAVGYTPQVEALAGVYAVVSVEDERVITIGHRFN